MTNKASITLKALPVKGKGKSDKEVVLILQGDLNIENSHNVRDFLLDNLKKYEGFTLKVNEVVSIDLGIIQLIQRFIWDAQAENKNSTIELSLSQEQKKLLEKSGFNSLLALSKK
jgi:anti-anti-sigma regulatory factor